MNKIGVIICNYNKSEYLKNCVTSILGQSLKERDIYVVDNASVDNSVSMLRETFGKQVTFLQNEENLGGAGGFDRGLEHCLEQGYPYMLLVDNDTRFDSGALEKMYDYLESHSDVGMCGAGIWQMENPDFIQEIGGTIDYHRQEICPNYRNCGMTEKIPEEVDCDYLAACALLVRREVIEKIGIMRKDYFVYWDDIEWCRRCTDAGYRLVALRDARVWHNWSASAVTKFNAFSEYYGRRNKLRFFASYIDEKDIDVYVENTLRNMFHIIYGHYRKGAFEEMNMSLYALDDVIHGVWGKAPSYKITVKKEAELPLEKLLKSQDKVCLIANSQMGEDGGITAVERVVRYCNPKLDICVCAEEEAGQREKGDMLYLKPCSHVIGVKENILPTVYLDRFFNCLALEEDYTYFGQFENAYGLFYRLYEPLLREGVKRIRENI